MSIDVQDKTALVTGANRGIGKAIVESLINAGAAKVYAAVRNTESAQPLVDQFGDKLVPIRVDLDDHASIDAAASTASDVEIVINNAGILLNATPLTENAVEALQKEMNTNVIGLIKIAQAFAPVLKQNGGGALVQLNSVASMKCFADFATYSASKAAAYSITQALKEKLETQGTLVISVHPGPIETDMLQTAGLGGMGEPVSVVADAIVDGLKSGEFHVFPDTMAKQIGAEYESFSKNIVEANLMEE